MSILTEKEKKFTEEYLIDLNATQAALRAGYGNKPTSASVTGCNLLVKPNIQEALREAMEERAERTKVCQDRVVNELAKIAFSNIRDFATWNADGVTIISSKGLSPEDAACVIGVTESYSAGGVKNISFKLHDKLKALELLARHLGMFNDKLTVEGKASHHLEVSPEMRRMLNEIYCTK